MNIYIIDDNEIDLIIGRKLLERKNNQLKIEVCQDPALALAQISNTSIEPDVILLDWHMPILNAAEWLARYIEQSNASIPVYILTSSIDPRDRKKTEKFKIVKGFFIKPLTDHHIDKILKNNR